MKRPRDLASTDQAGEIYQRYQVEEVLSGLNRKI